MRIVGVRYRCGACRMVEPGLKGRDRDRAAPSRSRGIYFESRVRDWPLVTFLNYDTVTSIRRELVLLIWKLLPIWATLGVQRVAFLHFQLEGNRYGSGELISGDYRLKYDQCCKEALQ